jgi:hypothetical protein
MAANELSAEEIKAKLVALGLEKANVNNLRAELQKLGLSTSGLKAELEKRLCSAAADEARARLAAPAANAAAANMVPAATVMQQGSLGRGSVSAFGAPSAFARVPSVVAFSSAAAAAPSAESAAESAAAPAAEPSSPEMRVIARNRLNSMPGESTSPFVSADLGASAAAGPSPAQRALAPTPAFSQSSQLGDASCAMEDDPACAAAENRDRAQREIERAAKQEATEEYNKHLQVLYEFDRLTNANKAISDEFLSKVDESVVFFKTQRKFILSDELNSKINYLEKLSSTRKQLREQKNFKNEQTEKASNEIQQMIEKFKGTDEITLQEMNDLERNFYIFQKNRPEDADKVLKQIKEEFYNYGLKNGLQTTIAQLNRSLTADIKSADADARKIRAKAENLSKLGLANQGPVSAELQAYKPRVLPKTVALLAYEQAEKEYASCNEGNTCNKTILARKLLRLREEFKNSGGVIELGRVVLDAETNKVKLAYYWLNFFKGSIKDPALLQVIPDFIALQTYRICQLRADKGVTAIIDVTKNIPNRLHSLVTTQPMLGILKLTRECQSLRQPLKAKLNNSQSMAEQENPEEEEREIQLLSKLNNLLRITVAQRDQVLFNDSKLFIRRVMKLALETDTDTLVPLGLVDCRSFFNPAESFLRVLDEPVLAAADSANNTLNSRLAIAVAARRTLTQKVDAAVKAAGANRFCPFYLDPLITRMIEECAQLNEVVETLDYARSYIAAQQQAQDVALAREAAAAQAQEFAQAQRQANVELYNRIGRARQALLVQTSIDSPIPRLTVFYNAIMNAGRLPDNDAEIAQIATAQLGLNPQLIEHAIAVNAMRELVLTGYLSKLLSRVNPATLPDTDPMKQFILQDYIQRTSPLLSTSPALRGGKRQLRHKKSRNHKKRLSRKYRFIRKTRRNRK